MSEEKNTMLEAEQLRTIGQIVSAFLERTSVTTAELPALIRSVRDALDRDSESAAAAEPADEAAAEPREPAVPVRRSVRPDHLVCLVCGAKQKTLRRHLDTAHGLTPDAYRAMFNLPRDYPMVAAEYTARRSELAKRIGLGRRSSTPAQAGEAPSEPETARPPRRRRRRAA